MTIQEIINNCGGAEKVCQRVGNKGPAISKDAIRKWRSNGIPEKYWQTLFELSPSLDATVIHHANLELREGAK